MKIRTSGTTYIALFATLAIAAIVPIGRGILRTYIDQSDPDIVFAYQALQLNDGDGRINAEHTGYVYFLILAQVFRLAAAVGFIDLARLTQFQNLTPEAFDAAYTGLIVTGRVLSMLLAMHFIVVMFIVGRALARSDLGGLIAAFLTAVSWGTASQSLLLRTELLSALFVFAAFGATLAATRATDSRNAIWMLATGLTTALAVATKLQAIVPLLCIVGLALAFGERPPPDSGASSPVERKALAGLWLLAAFVAATPAATMLISGIAMRKGSGIYQALIALYIASALLAYSLIHRVSATRTAAGSSALLFGFATGILLHLVYPNPPATDAMATFVEHMAVYARGSLPTAVSFNAVVLMAVDSFLATLTWRLGGIHVGERPFQIIESLVIAVIVFNVWARRRRDATLSALLLATGYVTEAWSRFRGIHAQYLVYIDPWLALAAATAVCSVARHWHWRFPAPVIAGAAALLLTIAIAQVSMALNPRFLRTHDPDNACYQANVYMRALVAQFQKFCHQT